MSLVETFCHVDDFCQEFELAWERWQLQSGLRQRRRKSRLSLREVMTIIIHFHQSGYHNFKCKVSKFRTHKSPEKSYPKSLGKLYPRQKRRARWDNGYSR